MKMIEETKISISLGMKDNLINPRNQLEHKINALGSIQFPE